MFVGLLMDLNLKGSLLADAISQLDSFHAASFLSGDFTIAFPQFLTLYSQNCGLKMPNTSTSESALFIPTVGGIWKKVWQSARHDLDSSYLCFRSAGHSC
jgi:hypothetical protein